MHRSGLRVYEQHCSSLYMSYDVYTRIHAEVYITGQAGRQQSVTFEFLGFAVVL